MSSNATLLAPTTVRDILQVYTVHETGVDQVTTTRTRGKTSLKTQQVQAEAKRDANWPQDWRGMPSYRETSRSHRLADRPAGKDLAESVVVTVMFTGVFVAGGLNALWRSTIGRWNENIMRYDVGGEW